MRTINTKGFSVTVSLVVAIVFAIANSYVTIAESVLGAVILAVMISLLTYVCIEIPKYVNKLNLNDELDKYREFVNNGITNFYPEYNQIDYSKDISSANNIKWLST